MYTLILHILVSKHTSNEQTSLLHVKKLASYRFVSAAILKQIRHDQNHVAKSD